MTSEVVWRGGELRIRNLGPASGDHVLGSFQEPGHYEIRGRNAQGKSTIIRLLARLQDEKMNRAGVNITDGEMSAELQLAAAKVTFRQRPGRDAATPKRENVETLPPIEELATPIEIMISGGKHKGEEARAKARLEALLTYLTIDATEDTVRALGACVTDRELIAGEIDPDRRELWDRLTAEARERNSRLKLSPFHDADELVEAVLDEEREGLLDDHGLFLARLNTLVNTGGKVSAEQQAVVAGLEGRLEEAASQAASAIGETLSDAFIDRLAKAPTGSDVDERAATAAEALNVIQLERRRRVEEEERVERLRASHGERPSAKRAQERLNAATEAVAAAQGDVATAQANLQAVKTEAAEIDEANAGVGAGLSQRIARWNAAVAKVAGETRDGVYDEDEISKLEPLIANAIRRGEDVHDFLASSAETIALHAQASKRLIEAEDALSEAQQTLASASSAEADRREESSAIAASVASWDETNELLERDIPGPTEEDVAAVKREAEEAAEAKTLARVSEDYRRIAAKLAEAREMLDWIDDVTTEYELGAKATWKALGDLVTDTLGLPWLVVEGMDMIIRYGADGELWAGGDGEPEERHIDDEERISTAELHEAMLTLMLERREAAGGLLILPWTIPIAFDDDRSRLFSAQVAGHDLFTLAERPWRDGDPEDLALVYIEPAEAA